MRWRLAVGKQAYGYCLLFYNTISRHGSRLVNTESVNRRFEIGQQLVQILLKICKEDTWKGVGKGSQRPEAAWGGLKAAGNRKS